MRRNDETGAGHAAFPSTHWSVLFAAKDPDAPRHQEALQKMFSIYWRPVFAYFRAAASLKTEDAKDWTQDFFLRVSEGAHLDGYDPDKGRFRAYLKGALRHFLLDRAKAASRQKRGGGRKFFSIDMGDQGTIPVPDDSASPEEQFDRSWAESLFQHARDRLREEMEALGRGICYEVFESSEREGDREQPSYARIAQETGITEDEVRVQLRYARLRLRKILTQLVSDTVGNEEDVYQELKDLLES